MSNVRDKARATLLGRASVAMLGLPPASPIGGGRVMASIRDLTTRIEKGQVVSLWFDTGAFGARLLYGMVIASGPKSFTVEWQSGIVNRISQDDPHGVEAARDGVRLERDHLGGGYHVEFQP